MNLDYIADCTDQNTEQWCRACAAIIEGGSNPHAIPNLRKNYGSMRSSNVKWNTDWEVEMGWNGKFTPCAMRRSFKENGILEDKVDNTWSPDSTLRYGYCTLYGSCKYDVAWFHGQWHPEWSSYKNWLLMNKKENPQVRAWYDGVPLNGRYPVMS